MYDYDEDFVSTDDQVCRIESEDEERERYLKETFSPVEDDYDDEDDDWYGEDDEDDDEDDYPYHFIFANNDDDE